MPTTTRLLSYETRGDALEVTTDGATVRIQLLDGHIARVRACFGGTFPPSRSYAVVRTAWPDANDELLADERTRVDPLPIETSEDDRAVRVSWGDNALTLIKDPFQLVATDAHGRVFHRSLAGRGFELDANRRVTYRSSISPTDHFYGFGEKSGSLNKVHHRMRMHNVDTFGWDPVHSDPLYKVIPFYLDLDQRAGVASGVFIDNAWDAEFDIGSEYTNYVGHVARYTADGGELDIYLIAGPSIPDVVEHYTDLTGKTRLAPLASLGYLGSTMAYTELPGRADHLILGFADLCARHGIPCDGFFLSSGYSLGQDGKRYAFHWNQDKFPDPARFVRDMADKGMFVAPNIKAGMLDTHPLTEEFTRAGAFVRDAGGERPAANDYWGGQAHFVDFAGEAGRTTWNAHLRASYLDHGITAVWNDNNEFEIDDPAALAGERDDPRPVGGLRPVLANLMAKSTLDALHESHPGVRPYVVSRAGYAGLQRYAQTWAGDNSTSWESLRHNIATILGMGLSGVANQGCDVGGFVGPAPEPELFVRWVQNGIFFPRFSIHSVNSDNTVTEPWTYPSFTPYVRDAIRLRYRLVPYLYSLLYEASTVGSPIMRPLVYEFQDDPRAADEQFEFLLGPSLLIANVLEPGAARRRVYLPAGSAWVDLATGARLEGGQEIEVEVDLGSIPMYLRSGGVVPQADWEPPAGQVENLHRDRVEHLRLLVDVAGAGPDGSAFVLYEDDGVTNDYLAGHSRRTRITTCRDGRVATLALEPEGDFASPVVDIVVELVGLEAAPMSVRLDGTDLGRHLWPETFAGASDGWIFDGEGRRALLRFRPTGGAQEVTLTFGSLVLEMQ